MTAGTANTRFPFPSAVLVGAWAAFVVYGSLVPFEFRWAAADRLASHFLGLGLSERPIRSFTDWATNIAIFVPLGFFGLPAVIRSEGFASLARSTILVVCSCILLSLGIEFAQVYFPPRDSSLLDVIANAMGAAFGIVGWVAFGDGAVEVYCRLVFLHKHASESPAVTGKLRAALLGACAALIAGWAGFFSSGWTGWDVAVARLKDLHLMPFVEHQAADIGLALISTAFAGVVYAAIGGALWLVCNRRTPLQARVIATAATAAGLALLVEGAKLFLVAKKPDTGNIVIAGLAAALGYLAAPLVTDMFRRQSDYATFVDDAEQAARAATAPIGLITGRAFAVTCAIAACALVTTYPLGRIPLGVALLAYGAALARHPTAWLLVVPALLPVLDLAPWTGRFFFDEFDGFVLVTLTVGLWRAAGQPLAASAGRVFWMLVAGFSVSFLVSAAIGLVPFQPPDANALTSPYSHYSALRLAKGLAFGAGLGVLMSSQAAAGHDLKWKLAAGMTLGLAAAAVSVVWERIAYVGLTDFASDFRVAGLFSTMNAGGAHLDAFLVTGLPFAAAWALLSRRPATRIAAAALFVAGTYAVMMTFSRAAVAGLAIGVLVIAAWAFLSGRRTAGHAVSTGMKAAAGLILAGMTIIPVLLGSFMQSRLSATGTDMETRTSHWSDAIRIMTEQWSASMFGMGLGRYPETHLLLSRETNKPAVFHFETEGDNILLRINHGAPLYVEQIVAVKPHRDYRIALRARAQDRSAAINVLICDRTFFHGVGCRSVTFQITGEPGRWNSMQATLNSATLGENPLRTTKLSLEHAGSGMPIDLDDVALVAPDGTNLLANGDFHAGMDRWFFSSPNNHLPWHIKNLWLEVFFDQGWFGLLTFCSLIAATVAGLARLASQGKAFATILLAALLGFLAVGAFDSMFDAPRLTLVFGLLIAASGIIYAQPRQTAKPKELSADAHAASVADKPVATGHNVPAPLSDSSAESPGVINKRLEPSWRRVAVNSLVSVLILTVTIAVVMQLPFVPYNVRKLPNPFHPLLAPFLLAAFVFWALGVPAVAARWLVSAERGGIAYPLALVAYGLIAWAMLRFAVPPEMIHKVIGAPVLGWPWVVEDIARFVPLVSVLSVQLTGGALLAAALTGAKTARAPVWWFASAAILFPIQYWVIVSQAATDNLTELMADDASAIACLLLSSYLLLIGTTSSLLASLRSGVGSRRIILPLITLPLSLPLGYILLSAGTETVIVKYQTAFSALQFLLSTDRQHYATGSELWIRFSAAHLAAVFATALVQYPLWIGFQARSRRWQRRKAA